MSPSRAAELRRNWSRKIERPRPREIIGLYHDGVADPARTVDAATRDDLGLDDLFAALDRTTGMPGRQVLYHQLHTYVSDPAVLAERTRQYGEFRREAPLRERIQLLLERLDRPGSEYVAPLLLGGTPPRPPFAWVFYFLSAASAASLVGTFFFHPLLVVALLLVLVNAAIYATYGQKIAPHFSGFAQTNSLLGVAAELALVEDPSNLPQLAELRVAAALIARLRRRLGWLVMDRAAQPELMQIFFGYLNMSFLIDIVVYLHSIHLLQENQAALLAVFEAVGSLDAAVAIASYLEGADVSTVPALVDDRRIEAVGLYHPLIPHPVANDFSLTDRGALIAGPNMAGKTAFIRTIGTNLILAQTFNFCLAQRAVLPRARVRSSIRREDQLSDGESYFFTEIKQVLGFTQAAAGGPRQVFLIDEIFRGTNTVERIASSAAVLRYLARQQIVFATTHDAELQAMLADGFAMFHFTDQVVDQRYGFDYRIQPGPVRSRNAIKLLALSGYPPEITDEAARLAAEIEAGAGHRSPGRPE